jgi:hypothetical protein
VYYEQAFQLLAVEKWHLHFPDRTRDLEDESQSERLKKTDLVGPIAELHLCEAIYLTQGDI